MSILTQIDAYFELIRYIGYNFIIKKKYFCQKPTNIDFY
jgi:hypothetical protein